MSTVFAPFVTAAEPFYSVRLSYLTDILTAEDGTEQRVMLRIIPTREHSFLARTYQTYRTGWLDALTYGNQSSQLAVPEWPHGTFLTSAVTAGSAKVFNVITTADADFAVDGYAVLWNDEGHTEEVTITAKTATSITATTAFNWAAGTFVIPAHRGNYAGSFGIRRPSARVADLPVTLTLEHGADPEVSSPTSAQVFTTVPYMRVDVSHDLTRQVERLESPTYTFADYRLGDSPIGRRPFRVWLNSRASVASLVTWFHGVRGRYKTFYLPTYQEDLHVTAGLGTTTLSVKRCGYTEHLWPMASRKILAAIEPDGTVTKCTVLDATVIGDTETLTLDTAAPSGSMISYLLYGRLESDTLEIVWRTNGFADCAMGFVECPAELAPTEFEAIPDDDNAGAPNVAAGPVVANMSTAVVPAGREDLPTVITVTARDANGIRLTTGGQTVAGSVTGTNTASLVCTDLSNGQHRCTYTPADQGTDSIAITLNASAIKNSPYTSIVGPTAVTTDIPFGFSSFASFEESLDYVPNITGIYHNLPASGADALLDIVAAHGAKMVFAIPRPLLRDSAGRVSLSRFQSAVDTLAAAPGMAGHIASGTAGLHVVIDDVGANHWGGVEPSISLLSAMCAYSKSVWPDTPTMVRKTPDALLGMENMDFAAAVYRADRGDVTAYRSRQERAAEQIGCDIMFGLHTVNGGDGSSGIPGTGERDGWYAMTATEILRYGRVLLASPYCKWWNMYRFHGYTPHLIDYYALPSITTAITTLAAEAAAEVR